MSGIKITTNFDLQSSIPIDGRTSVQSLSDITAPYEGLVAYQKSDKIHYKYVDGAFTDINGGIKSDINTINNTTIPAINTSIGAIPNQTYITEKAKTVDMNTALGLKANQADLVATNNNVATNATQIASLASGSPKGTYGTVALLTTAFPSGNTNTYVVTTDGNWYYWNGTIWTSGGTYQSTGIASGGVVNENLDITLQRRAFLQRRQGKNPVYETVNPWNTLTSLGTGTVTWKANTGLFIEGDNYLEIVRGGTEISVGDNIQLDSIFQKDITKKARIEITYSSTTSFNFSLYQKPSSDTGIYCNPNTSVSISLPSTGGAIKTTDITGVILWDSLYLMPYIVTNGVGTVNIGSVKCSIFTVDNNSSIDYKELTDTVKSEFFSQVKFGANAVYKASSPWACTANCTPTWKANIGLFKEGNNYLEVVKTIATADSALEEMVIPLEFQKNITKTVKIRIVYTSNSPVTFLGYQRKSTGVACSPNTSVSYVLPITNGIANVVNLIVPILADSTIILPYFSFASIGTLNIGSVTCSVLGDSVATIAPLAVSSIPNVIDYGATGNGVTVDTTAIQTAHNSGKSISYPDGTYLATGLTSGICPSIYGTGGTSVLKSNANGDLLTINQDEFSISNMQIEGTNNVANTLERGIVITAKEFLKMSKVNFKNLKGSALFIYSSYVDHDSLQATDLFFRNNNIGVNCYTRAEFCSFSNCHFNGNTIGALVASGNVTFNGCEINNNVTGINLVAGDNDSHGIISNCNIDHNTGDGLVIDSITNGETISSCHIYESGIWIKNCTGKAIRFDNCVIDPRRLLIENCTNKIIFNNCYFPNGFFTDISKLTITNSTIKGTGNEFEVAGFDTIFNTH